MDEKFSGGGFLGFDSVDEFDTLNHVGTRKGQEKVPGTKLADATIGRSTYVRVGVCCAPRMNRLEMNRRPRINDIECSTCDAGHESLLD